MQKKSAAPLVSIVVLYLEGSPWISACLESLRRHLRASQPHEVILLANGMAPEAQLTDADRQGVVHLRSNVNLGFGGGCNWAARHAQGEHLLFLNDDTIIQPGWLDSLLAPLQSNAAVGAAGSLLVTPDGRIEEAGRVLWRDGVSHGIAHGLPAAEAHVPAVREVDACSGCSLLVRRSAWESVGGFDARYFPAYYEDADLCLELRRRGWAVVCASRSTVRHRRSSSTPLLWRRFLGLRNHRVFVDKWGDILAEFEARPRDQPSLSEIEGEAQAASQRRLAIYHRFGMQAGGDSSQRTSATRGEAKKADGPSEAQDRMELLEQEVRTLQAEVRLKDEYIADLVARTPDMERALQRLLREERSRERRRELLRDIPVLGASAVWLKRRLDASKRNRV